MCHEYGGEDYCGIPTITATYYKDEIPSKTILAGNLDDIFGFNFVDPSTLAVEFEHNVPIKWSNPINFKSCKMFAGGQKCNSCTICNVGKGFNYDCSNVWLEVTGGSSIYLYPIKNCINWPTVPSFLHGTGNDSEF